MILDLITGLLVAYGFYQGYTKGLVKTVFATLSVLIAVIVTLKLSHHVIEFLQGAFSINPAILFVLGFVLTFIATMALVRFLGTKLESIFKSLHLSSLNKIMGGLVLGLFYAILISIGVFFMNKMELLSDDLKSVSFTYPLLEPLPKITQGVGESLKPIFIDFWDALINTMDTINDKSESLKENK